MSKLFIDPFNDFFVRYLFGSEGNEDICKDFINAVLTDSNFPRIDNVMIKNPFNLKSDKNGKESITDIKVESSDGRILNVEVQKTRQPFIDKRALFYWAKNYSKQLKQGQLYDRLNPVIIIILTDFTVFSELQQLHSCFLLKELNKSEFVLNDDIMLHFIEAPKIELSTQLLTNQLNRWIAFFKAEGKEDKEEVMKFLFQHNPNISKAHDLYNRFSEDEKYVDVYEYREKWEHDYATNIHEAERRGIEQGRNEKMKEVAKKCLEQGLDLQTIQLITGLNEKEIQNL